MLIFQAKVMLIPVEGELVSIREIMLNFEMIYTYFYIFEEEKST